MSDKIGEVKFLPAFSYNIMFSIKDMDFSQDVQSVRIVNSIIASQPIIIIKLFVDPDEIVLEKIYGQDPIILTVILHGQDAESNRESTEFELMAVNHSFPIQYRPKSNEAYQVPDRVPVSIITIPRSPFKTMTSYVNEVYSFKTLKDTIQDLINNTSSNTELEYDSDDQNQEVIDQIVIPPTTLYNAIQYLDDTFGLFDGIPSIYCTHDNKLQIKNLTKRINKPTAFTIYHLATELEQEESPVYNFTDDEFYTFSPIQTTYAGNTVFANLSKNLKFIVRPKDTLYHQFELNLEDVCAEYGICSESKEVFIDTLMNERTKFYIDDTGYEYTESFAKSRISKLISSVATISLEVERNIHITNLLRVGDAVEFETKTLEYIALSGKYILKSTDIVFSRDTDWFATAKINLMRTHNLNN